jgi:hypothetical protein
VSPQPRLEPLGVATEVLARLLAGLYRRQVEQLPDEAYPRVHSGLAFLRGTLAVDGCDVFDRALYQVFFEYAGMCYQSLSDAVRLPYADCSFDCAIASGVLAGGSPSPGYQAPTWDRNRPPRDRLRQHSHRRAPEGNLLGLHIDHADLAGVPAGL